MPPQVSYYNITQCHSPEDLNLKAAPYFLSQELNHNRTHNIMFLTCQNKWKCEEITGLTHQKMGMDTTL